MYHKQYIAFVLTEEGIILFCCVKQHTLEQLFNEKDRELGRTHKMFFG